MAPKVNNKEKDKQLGQRKSEKQKIHWTMPNKKTFIHLGFEQKRLANKLGKAFTSLGQEKK